DGPGVRLLVHAYEPCAPPDSRAHDPRRDRVRRLRRAQGTRGLAVKISYDPALPITARHDDIAAALRDNQVIVVAGETGSGKTTQLPKIAYELGRRAIAHTQPRRIAARSVARRIADECEVELGAEVGYAVRFDDQSSDVTAMKLV